MISPISVFFRSIQFNFIHRLWWQTLKFLSILIKIMSFIIYFLGLCLVEVVSGKRVFDDIENDGRAFTAKVSGAKPNIPVSLTSLKNAYVAMNKLFNPAEFTFFTNIFYSLRALVPLCELPIFVKRPRHSPRNSIWFELKAPRLVHSNPSSHLPVNCPMGHVLATSSQM